MDAVRFGTLCSGIEGAAVAWEPLDWTHVYSAEVDPFCRALLETRYPEIPNHGDVTKIQQLEYVDVLAAGTPCQPFSVQGKRGGLDDARGRLALCFVGVLRSMRPRWVVWENVPGVLSSNRGRDFGAFLAALDELGYGWAYRTLDAKYFGVAQRRRRVFVVGCRRSQQCAAAVLFDATSRTAPGGTSRPVPAGRQSAGPGAKSPLLGWSGDETPKFGIEISPTLRASQGGEGVGVVNGAVFRRFSVEEWEMLQGFPCGYTQLAGWSDRQRKRALGNAFCVPVLRWIGNRISQVGAV